MYARDRRFDDALRMSKLQEQEALQPSPVIMLKARERALRQVYALRASVLAIQNVYGGGNAAATPATELWIMGNYIIDNAFGGGNGTVTAANVGYRSDGTTSYGKGTAITNLVAGYVHEVYGGSNSQGNIREGADIKMPTIDKTQYDCCANIFTQKIYGGGKNADMEGGSNIVMGCMPGDRIDEVYGGAEMANVNGNVCLITRRGATRSCL